MEATRIAPPVPARSRADNLEAVIRGRVIRPTHAEYDDARQVWNAAFDRRPAVIVRPADAGDVAVAVRYAQATDRMIAVRSGGHSLAGFGTGDDVVVVDLSSLRDLTIDPEQRAAWAQPGLTAGEYTVAAAAYGLATPFGDTGSVGIGGLTLGGGIGFLARKHGLAIDSLLSAEVVTADGEILHASETSNPELFWAIRGGGGNFGIVTRFQFRLHPVGTVVGGLMVLPPTREVLLGISEHAEAAPRELTTITFLMHAPPLPFIPTELHGSLVTILFIVHAGDVRDGEAAVAPFRSLPVIVDLVRPVPYPAIYEMTAGGATRHASTSRSAFLRHFDGATIDTILDWMRRSPSPTTMAQLRVLGGAIGDVATDATAFAFRDRPAMLLLSAPYGPEEVETSEAWRDGFVAALGDRMSGVYSNFLEDEGQARIREAYPGATYERLVAAKRRYDPTNVFRLNQNIDPDA